MYIPTVLKTMIHDFAADRGVGTIEEMLADYYSESGEYGLYSQQCGGSWRGQVSLPVLARNELDLNETESQAFVGFIEDEYPQKWQDHWVDGWGYLLNAIHVFLVMQDE